MMGDPVQRPVISEYHDVVDFVQEMISYQKRVDPSYSIKGETQSLRRVSPSLISLILKRKRKINLDRVSEIGKLLHLTPKERRYLSDWIRQAEGHRHRQDGTSVNPTANESPSRQREVSTHILKDWINVYVKDCFQIEDVQKNPELLFQMLSHLASRKRLEGSLRFLLREGYLRKTLDHRIVVETQLAVADPGISDHKIRQFHKGALGVARDAIDLFGPHRRYANALILPLSEEGYAQLLELIADFAEELKKFASENHNHGRQLYQFILNLSPTGGAREI